MMANSYFKKFYICKRCLRPTTECGKERTNFCTKCGEKDDATYYREYFVCPHCKRPTVLKEQVIDRFRHGGEYCEWCGNYVWCCHKQAVIELRNHKRNLLNDE